MKTMNDIVSVFTDAAIAGVLADTSLFPLPNDDLIAIIDYEQWRSEFMAGTASLITAEGERITRRSLIKNAAKRRVRLRNPRPRRALL